MSDQTYNPTSKNFSEPLSKHISESYGRLNSLAGCHIAKEQYRDELEPVELLNEVCIRLATGSPLKDDSEAYFVSVASRKMALLLIDWARNRRAVKNGGGMRRVSIDNVDIPGDDYMESQLILSDAFTRLEAINEDQAAVAELVTFGKLTIKEAAQILNMSVGVATKHWKGALAWFRREVYSNGDAA
jgi:RNA polymerase sigma-70 factor, ECF subfamily